MAFLEWWNLIFVLPFLGALMYLLLLISGVTLAEGDFDLDADLDVVAGFEPGVLAKVLSFFGAGKVPMAILMMSACFTWGAVGYLSNIYFENILKVPSVFIWPSMAIACISSFLLTSVAGRAMAKLMPSTESYASSNRDLINEHATVRYKITAKSGSASLYDEYGTLREVPCRVNSGELSIERGRRVLLLSYDRERKAFVVCDDPPTAIENPSFFEEPEEQQP